MSEKITSSSADRNQEQQPRNNITGQMTRKEEISENELPNLTKFLSSSGVAQRRKCAELIKDGCVSVNGTTETNPGRRITAEDKVVCQGKSVCGISEKYYIMLNKPRGYVCTNDDIHAKKKAIELISLPEKVRLFSAGRLDKDSEGLILFSNDGKFTEKLTHPSHEIIKTYEVSLETDLSETDIRSMLSGIEDNGEILKAVAVKRIRGCKFRICLQEGKNREIRRMIYALGHDTKRLRRVSVGQLRLGGLPVGQWRLLTQNEIAAAFLCPNFSN